MGFILPGCNADSCSCLQVRSLRLFCCKVLQSKRSQEGLQACTHCWAPSSALGHSGWHRLKADPEVSAEQTEQMGKRCFSHPHSEEKQCQINGQKETETKQQGVCVHIKSFSIPSLCFSCYLETDTESNVPFASHSSWDLCGTIYAWVTQLLEAIRQGNFTSS